MRSRITKNKILTKHSILLCLLLMSILLMGIGYSAINSITGEISGTAIAEQQKDVFITNVEYVSDVNADTSNSNITYYIGTFMQSTIKLSETDPNSEITYKVTVYNNSENTYPFLTVLYDEEFYDNPNIVFEIKDTGFKIGDLINGKETKEIYITFKYKDGVLPENKTLNSNINFKIANPNRLKKAEYGSSTSNYLGSTITRDKIESVKFELGTLQPEGTVASFDASEKQDESIIGYYTDTDSNGMYELTFLSAEPIASNVDGNYLFCYLSNVKEITFNNFTTYGVTSMENMFYQCGQLTELHLDNFNTSKVTTMMNMFSFCNKLTELDVSSFDTRQVTDMESMFSSCEELTALNISNFNTSQVTNMYCMFAYCKKLIELDVSGLDTSQVTDMKSMFYACYELTALNISNFNTSQVTNMNGMFYNCKKLTELDLSGFDTSRVTDMGSMFLYCSGLTKLDLNGFDTSQVTNMQNMFYYCNGLTSLDVSKFNTSQVTNMNSMFYYCQKLTELDVSGFDTSKVTNMNNMFSYCQKLTELDVSGFDTSQVTNMSAMFSGCIGLTSLDVGDFNTSKVTNMRSLFNYCTKLAELDLSNFDTSQVTNMNSMFNGCSGLTTIYVSKYDDVAGTGWTTLAVTNSSNMFGLCTKLVGQNGTAYDSAHVDAEYARIDLPGTPGYLTDIQVTSAKKPSEIFDPEGTNPDGLHIGDFVNYDAGTWTQAEINSIKTGLKSNPVTANGSTALPTQGFQFGGFTAGSSRNGNATPSSRYSGKYNYVKDKETGDAITGWRVFDIQGDKVTLISAGNSEDFMLPFDGYNSNNGYITEYILTGNINGSWSNGTTEAGKYQKRDWNMYVNRSQYGESATVLTKVMLDAWYTKYIDTPNADTYLPSTFQKIYQEPYLKYQNMIENYSFYWIASARDNCSVYCGDSSLRVANVLPENESGVRPVVTLTSNVQFKATKAGTKTVTGGNTTKYGGDQTYNVWDIATSSMGPGEILTPQTLTAKDYGGQVSNYKPTNGSTVGWKIFHTDGQNIYLIADNYIPNQYKPKGKKGTTYNSSKGTYGANLNAGKDYAGITEILSNLKTKWLSQYTYTSTYNNMKATAYLLDTNVWSTFKDGAGYAEYALGGPTLELFTASYNVTHDTDINTRVSSSVGYQMKWSSSNSYSSELANLNTNESLYIINNTYSGSVFGMWLASPNANSSDSVCLVRCEYNGTSARINSAAYTSYGGGLRPVIVLKSNYGLEVQVDGTYMIKQINT